MDEVMEIPGKIHNLKIVEVVQDYGKRLFNFIRRQVKNDEEAEDILQDVWYQLSSVIDTEPIEQLGGWLYRVSKNRIIDKSRKQSTLSLEDFAYEDEEGEPVFPESLFTGSTNLEKEFEDSFFMETLLAALDELPGKQREVFTLNELEGFTLQEIADKTGENLKTIISRKRYAVAQLKKKLLNMYQE
jgi:RNA polymerase sigma factor (sigma-70 family)